MVPFWVLCLFQTLKYRCSLISFSFHLRPSHDHHHGHDHRRSRSHSHVSWDCYCREQPLDGQHRFRRRPAQIRKIPPSRLLVFEIKCDSVCDLKWKSVRACLFFMVWSMEKEHRLEKYLDLIERRSKNSWCGFGAQTVFFDFDREVLQKNPCALEAHVENIWFC